MFIVRHVYIYIYITLPGNKNLFFTREIFLLCKNCTSSPVDVTEAKDPVPCSCFFFPFSSETKTYSRTQGFIPEHQNEIVQQLLFWALVSIWVQRIRVPKHKKQATISGSLGSWKGNLFFLLLVLFVFVVFGCLFSWCFPSYCNDTENELANIQRKTLMQEPWRTS